MGIVEEVAEPAVAVTQEEGGDSDGDDDDDDDEGDAGEGGS